MLERAVNNSQKTHCSSIIKRSLLILFREIFALYSADHMQQVNKHYEQNAELIVGGTTTVQRSLLFFISYTEC
jgi:hypothetical protein